MRHNELDRNNKKPLTIDEQTIWPFNQKLLNGTIQYFVEIAWQDNEYQAKIHQGNPNYSIIRSLSIEPQQNLPIKESSILFKKLVHEMISIDITWHRKWFDEQAQYEIGHYFYKQLFGNHTVKSIQQNCKIVDIRIITDDPHIAWMPWMLLAQDGIFLYTLGWSIIFSHSYHLTPCQLPIYPKILIAAPQPSDLDPTDSEQHITALNNLLYSFDSRYTQGIFLKITHTWEIFEEALRQFQPHIVYYYGYGIGNHYFPKLVFNDVLNNRIDKPISDIISLIQSLKQPPIMAYMNCCNGKSDSFLSLGVQLAHRIPVVVVNRTDSHESIAHSMGLSFWEDIIIHGMSPHEAILNIRMRVGEELRSCDTRWIIPFLHCQYDQWNKACPNQNVRLDINPHWRLKIHDFKALCQIKQQVSHMIMGQQPYRTLVYLLYGQPNQGIDMLQHRIIIDLQEKYPLLNIVMIQPEWPPDHEDCDQSFTHMINAATQIPSLDCMNQFIQQVPNRIPDQPLLIFIRHMTHTSINRCHPTYIQSYLEWLDLTIAKRLPDRVYLLVGLSFEDVTLQKFRQVYHEYDDLKQITLNHSQFLFLEELDKITRKDIITFLKNHHIQIPKDWVEDFTDRLIKKTNDVYEKIIDELTSLACRNVRKID